MRSSKVRGRWVAVFSLILPYLERSPPATWIRGRALGVLLQVNVRKKTLTTAVVGTS